MRRTTRRMTLPREPRGAAANWTSEQIAALAEVSAGDITRAGRQWEKDAPVRFRDLLDATTEPTDAR